MKRLKIPLIENDAVVLSIYIVTAYVLSNTLFSVFHTTSLRYSMIISMTLTIFLVLIKLKNTSELIKALNLKFVLLVFIGLMVHSILSIFLISKIALIRMFLSVLLICVALGISSVLNNIISKFDQISLHKVLNSLYYFLFGLGIVMAIIFRQGIVLDKNMIIFKEPSHYALYFIPLILYKLYNSSIKQTVISYIILIVLALSLENLTLVVGMTLVLLALLFRNKKFIVICFILVFVSILTLSKAIDISYYTDRLNLSLNSSNLSVLVFVSGWERTFINFVDTYGFGIGFQRMGYIGDYGVAMSNISSLLNGRFINLYDAGSTAPKMISELGIFGVALLVFYLAGLYSSLNKFSNNKLKSSREIFLTSIYISFSIQLFIRGIGYFSPISFFFYTSCMALINTRKARGTYDKRLYGNI